MMRLVLLLAPPACGCAGIAFVQVVEWAAGNVWASMEFNKTSGDDKAEADGRA